MYPTQTHELTRIRQAELRREAAEHRLAKAAQGDRHHHDPFGAVRHAVATLFQPLRTTGASPA